MLQMSAKDCNCGNHLLQSACVLCALGVAGVGKGGMGLFFDDEA